MEDGSAPPRRRPPGDRFRPAGRAMKRGVFVTGTDTEVGKTVAAAALVAAVRARGLRVAPMKPIAAGAVERDGQWINEDTEALLAAAGLDRSQAARVTPVLLRE